MPIKHYKNGQGIKPPVQSSSGIFGTSSDESDGPRTPTADACATEVNNKRPLLNCGSHDIKAIMVQLPDCSTVVVCEKCKAEIKSADEKEDASRYELFPEASDSEPDDDNTTVNNPDGAGMPTV